MSGYIIKRKDGLGIRFYAEKETGEKEQVYLYEKGWTKDDAEAAMVEYKKKSMGGYTADPNITVSEYLDKWFDDYAKHNLEHTTQVRYAELIRLHIAPALGHIQLSKLKPAQIQSFYTSVTKSKKTIKKKVDGVIKRVETDETFSPTTVLHIHRVFHLALRYAVQWQYIMNNPVESCKPPRQKKELITVLSDKQVEQLLQEVKDEAAYIVIYIAVTTGMRLGEICGLQNEDVDAKGKMYTVRYGYKRVAGEMTLKSTKTHRSKRPIPMLPGTDKIIQNYIDDKENQKVVCIKTYAQSAHFCVWKDGTPILPDYATKCFKRYARKLGFDESITFHTLRHTHATWLLRQGVHPKVVSERLGHASVNITLNTYSHLIPDMQKDIINGLDTKMFAEKAQK